MGSKFKFSAKVTSPTTGQKWSTSGEAIGTDEATAEDVKRGVLSELRCSERDADVTVTKIR